MIAKKSKRADLEKRRFAFFQIGLLISASLVLAAFEYRTAAEKEEQFSELYETDEVLSPEVPPEQVNEPDPPKKNKRIINLDDVDSLNIVKELKQTKTSFSKETKSSMITIEEGDPGIPDYENIVEESMDSIHLFSDIPPKFPGGEKAMYEWIAKEIHYPQIPRELGIGGLVYTGFIVNTDGTIEQVKILRGQHEDLDREALRVLRKMPRWEPAESGGKKVRVQFMLPFLFSQIE